MGHLDIRGKDLPENSDSWRIKMYTNSGNPSFTKLPRLTTGNRDNRQRLGQFVAAVRVTGDEAL